jgi:pyruvate/2-oxoglutarate dehydrogenase complex dihydrolipoamide dehydrogenase (E3) component
MAQFYRRMGSRVTVIEGSGQIAGREDNDVASALQRFLESEGITFRLGARLMRIRRARRLLQLTLREKRRSFPVTASHLFIATGRRPNTSDLGLDKIGLRAGRDGTIPTDNRLATKVRGVWAAGDIRGGPMFTHTAWDDYRVLLAQLTGDRTRTIERIVPYAIFTDPQLGRVGMTEAQASALGRKLEVGRYEMKRNGKAKEIGETGGFIKIIAEARSRRILGGAVLAAEGAELVHLLIDVMNARATYDAIGEAIHIHPTLAEAVQSAVEAMA